VTDESLGNVGRFPSQENLSRFGVAGAFFCGLATLCLFLQLLELQSSKERIRQQDLFTFKEVIDQYTLDKRAAPRCVEDLVDSGYLRAISPWAREYFPQMLEEEPRIQDSPLPNLVPRS
jgi:hypothetical protein